MMIYFVFQKNLDSLDIPPDSLKIPCVLKFSHLSIPEHDDLMILAFLYLSPVTAFYAARYSLNSHSWDILSTS